MLTVLKFTLKGKTVIYLHSNDKETILMYAKLNLGTHSATLSRLSEKEKKHPQPFVNESKRPFYPFV